MIRTIRGRVRRLRRTSRQPLSEFWNQNRMRRLLVSYPKFATALAYCFKYANFAFRWRAKDGYRRTERVIYWHVDGGLFARWNCRYGRWYGAGQADRWVRGAGRKGEILIDQRKIRQLGKNEAMTCSVWIFIEQYDTLFPSYSWSPRMISGEYFEWCNSILARDHNHWNPGRYQGKRNKKIPVDLTQGWR